MLFASFASFASFVLLFAVPARAGDDVEAARRHFAEGVERYQNGDFEGARALFQRAETEHHAAPIIYNIGRAEERLGHPQAAVDSFEAYVAEAGEKGEFAQAAVVAIARIRGRSGQLRIETKPAGARLFVDGAPTRDAAPTRLLVSVGRHHVVAEGDGWRAEADVEAAQSAIVNVSLSQPERASAGAGPAPLAPLTMTPLPVPTVVPPPLPEVSDGFVAGGQFVIVPHRFDRTANKPYSELGLAAGLMLEAGFAPAEQFLVLTRMMLAAGSKGSPATVVASIGVAFTYRVHPVVWLGGAFQGGRALLPGAFFPMGGEQRRFDSDFVFCPGLEVSIAVLTRSYGQWLVSAFPGYYFASPTDNDVLVVPVGFGLRSW